MTAPFVIFGMPRSRTFWLSNFLSYRGWTCGHEELRHLRSIDDIKSWLALPMTGTAETAGAPWWRTLRHMAPAARVVIVRRPIADVHASMMQLGCGFQADALWFVLHRIARKLDQIEARWPGALAVTYRDLDDEAMCARVFEHCLPFPHDHDWWARVAALNLQCDMPALMRYCHAHMPQLEKVAAQVRQVTLATMQTRPVVEPDGITIQPERFADFYADEGVQALFRDHLVTVDEHPDNAPTKNIPMMQQADELGLMQVLTARSNGRVFGYLMTVLSPSWEDRSRTTAVNTLFYADPAVPGVGMKLQRAALATLKARGITEVYGRAGPRGSGPRMATLYRRLGFLPDGALFKLEMKEA